MKKKLLIDWDVKKDDEILFFDSNLSYEISGYRPINSTKGLDFKPEWFIEVRNTFLRTGHYCSFAKNSKSYCEFWNREYERCRNGLTVNGYTITGDHYFFLNYYQLMDLRKTLKAGEGRNYDFPMFYVPLYEFFHYLDLCKTKRMNAVLMKARGLGFSEMNAAIAANNYNSRRNSRTLIVATDSSKLQTTLDKVWKSLSFLNDYTDGGFFKLSQVVNTSMEKKSSHYKMVNGLKIEEGWMSTVFGITADAPSKIRGERVDYLMN